MRHLHVLAALMFVAAISGCVNDQPATQERAIKSDDKKPVVLDKISKEMISAIGGWENWKNISSIDADVTFTVCDAAGTKHINSQRHTYDLSKGTLTAAAQEGWKAEITDHGGKITGSGFTEPDSFRAEMVESLSMLLHRVRGPLNFASSAEKPGEPMMVKIGGDSYKRIPVVGDTSLAMAYYVDPQTSILKYMTSGADKPDENGTIAIYEYSAQPNGMMFPSKISILKIGQHSLIGTTLVAEASLKNIKFNIIAK